MELGEGASVATIKVDPDKYLKAKVTKVRFKGIYRACREKKEIDPDDWHWPAGKPDGYKKSKKAVVYQVKKDKTPAATVMLKIDSKGMSGNGKFTGTIGKLVFEGQTPLASGTHEVTVTLKETPESLHWARGMMTWEIDAGEHAALAGATQVELFFVFDDPASTKFFDPDGVWIEALRFIFKEARLEGAKQIKEGLGKVTQCCFELPQHKYEINEGAPGFGGFKGSFALGDYIKPKSLAVNCYDQTYAVIVFSGALGITMRGLYVEPFGYLKLTNLVGWGSCNNPFPETKFRKEKRNMVDAGKSSIEINALKKENYLVVDVRDPARSPFGNHMFCEHLTNIYDACAGAALGKYDRTGYLLECVDTVIPESGKYGNPSTREEIEKSGREKVVDYRGIKREHAGKTYSVNTEVKIVVDGIAQVKFVADVVEVK